MIKVYHLHLPRTSGVFLRNTLKLNNHISGHSFPIKISDFDNAEYVSGHYGVYPSQLANTTFSIFREPVQRSISYFKYIKEHFYQKENINELIENYLVNERLRESVSNLSNKFLTGNIDFQSYNLFINDHKSMVENGWFCQDYAINAKDSIEQIKNRNIDILYFNDPLLYKNIAKIYGIEIFGQPQNASKDYEVSKSLIESIKEINNIDMEIYEYFKR